MQVIILKTFEGKAGRFEPSTKVPPVPVNLETNYAESLIRQGLVRLHSDKPEPARKQSMPGAPNQKKPDGQPGSSRPLGDGPDLTPASSRAARAHAKKTPTKSAGGVTLK